MGLVNPFTGTEAKAKEPVNEDLMDKKYKENIEDLAVQIDNIQTGGGSSSIEDLLGTILTDKRLFSNEGVYFKKRFHVLTHRGDSRTSKNDFDNQGVDLEGNDKESRFFYKHDDSINYSDDFDADAYYKGTTGFLLKDGFTEFKIKKGENFFGIGIGILSSGQSDSVTVLIDGATPVSIGLEDQNGNAAPNTFGTNPTNTKFQQIFWYFGLDGGEHTVKIINTDSGSAPAYLNFVDIGYKPRRYTINHDIHVNKSKASIRGLEVNFPEGDFSFAKSIGYGHTGMIVGKTDGTIRVVDGLEPAKSLCKSGETIAFSGAVTSLPLKNTTFFPSSGIGLFQHPYGGTFQFSWSSKTEATIANHSLDNIIWKNQPQEDLDLEQGFSNNATTNAARLNAQVIYWAKPTINVTSANNKLDFEMTIIDGSGVPQTTTHVATLALGQYDDELVPLSNAIVKAMEAVKSIQGINGKYYAKFQKDISKWVIGAEGDGVTEVNFLFSSGANQANSIHSDLGYPNSDLSGDKFQYATTTKSHIAPRTMYADKYTQPANSPNVKFNTSTSVPTAPYNETVDRLGFTRGRSVNNSGEPTIQISPDPDACGVIVYIGPNTDGLGQAIKYTIDDQEINYILQPDAWNVEGSTGPNVIVPIIIVYPRGSKKITISDSRYNMFGIDIPNTTTTIHFAGYKQLYTRPNLENVATDEQVLKFIDVAPLQQYATIYANNAGSLYSPGSNDSINTVNETGSWGATTATTMFNGGGRTTSSTNAFVDYNITISGIGAIWLKLKQSTNTGEAIQMFISTGAIVESTDLVSTISSLSRTDSWSDGAEIIGINGIPAGTYNVRFKNIGVNGSLIVLSSGCTIADSVPPDTNVYVNTDATNNGQTSAYALHGHYSPMLFSSNDRVPSVIDNSAYKWGITSFMNYASNTNSWIANNFSYSVNIHKLRSYYGAMSFLQGTDYVEVMGLCKSITNIDNRRASTARSLLMTGFIDGVQMPNTTNPRVCGKNGSANLSFETSCPGAFKRFEFEGISMTGKVISIGDTRGAKPGQPILLIDNVGAEEQAVIASIVVGVSITIEKPLVVLTDADIIDIKFHGFHTMRVVNDDPTVANDYLNNNMILEPLDLQPSNFKKRNRQGTKLETAMTSETLTNGVVMAPPLFSDGSYADYRELNFSMIEVSSSESVDLRTWPVYVGTGTVTLKSTAQRLIADDINDFDWDY